MISAAIHSALLLCAVCAARGNTGQKVGADFLGRQEPAPGFAAESVSDWTAAKFFRKTLKFSVAVTNDPQTPCIIWDLKISRTRIF